MKGNMRFCVPCLFGVEGLVAQELRDMGLEQVQAENGRVLFSGGWEAMARANLCCRFGERVLLLLGEFPARSFEELFQGVKALPWEGLLGKEDAFPVTGRSLSSQLHSVPDCQAIIKKAIVERLKAKYKLSWFAESGALHRVRFRILKDQVSVLVDTSGEGLHKRGYRAVGVAAPLRETLAAAMVLLSRYRGRDPFCDPFCGSGTIPIEAALIAKNRAPGLDRSFSAQKWKNMPSRLWMEAADEAMDKEFHGTYDIWGGDIDPAAVELARHNAALAGVEDCIRFEVADAGAFHRESEYGQLVTNPPYGERLMDRAAAETLYRELGRVWQHLPGGWRTLVLSSHTEFERTFGRPADKKRKLYNGMLKCDLFMYGNV